MFCNFPREVLTYLNHLISYPIPGEQDLKRNQDKLAIGFVVKF